MKALLICCAAAVLFIGSASAQQQQSKDTEIYESFSEAELFHPSSSSSGSKEEVKRCYNFYSEEKWNTKQHIG